MRDRLVLQAVNAGYRTYAETTTPAMRKWSAANGWDYALEQLPDGNTFRSRYRLIRECLARYQSVFWLDVDIVPILKDDIVLPAGFDFCVSKDCFGWCAGAALYRSGPWSEWILDSMVQLVPEQMEHRLEEQDTLKALLEIRVLKKRVCAIEEWQISNPASQLGGRTPIMRHFWANRSYRETLEETRKFVNDFMAA